LSGRISAGQSGEAGLGPWIRFYALLLLIFFEVVAFVFQNIEKKRLGYELSVLVRHKVRLTEARERLRAPLLEWERLDELAGIVRSASLELEPNRWPVAWIDRND
jgi:hypothetical protein